MRPKKTRWVRCAPGERCFCPKGKSPKKLQGVVLALDEFEAVRLSDLEELEQVEVAKKMNVHRSTVSRILASGRKKIADALTNLKAIKVEGGCCKMLVKKILILCTGNSCRSQMAEGVLRHYGAGHLEVYSAGTKPSQVNPIAIQVMREIGIDISKHRSKHVDELKGISFDVVITVCDNAKESCPIFPRKTRTLHWGFPDPPHGWAVTEEVVDEFRKVRDMIHEKFKQAAENGFDK